MNEKTIRSIIRKNELSATNKKRKCFLPECELDSIASHLLQKNGILNRIAYKNHLYEIGIDPFKPQAFFFKKIGINEAFTFPGFCNGHDTKLFKEIETGEIDLKDYRTNLLFSYRILANELRKKEILIDWFSKNLKDTNLRSHIKPEYFWRLERNIEGFKTSLIDGDYYLSQFYSDLKNNTQNFTFYTIEVPFVEICASGVFTYETTGEMANIPDSQPLTDIYFNLLPLENRSVIIFGFLTEFYVNCKYFVDEFTKSNETNVLKKTSDVLLTSLENWLCSFSVMEKLKTNENEIVRLTHESIKSNNERRTLNFNLFDYIK